MTTSLLRGLAVGVWALCCACETVTPRTQVMLTVDADSAVRKLVTRFEVTITGVGSSQPSSFEADQDVDGAMAWPYQYALVPRGGDAKRTYRIVATAYRDTDRIAVLRTESGFVQHKTLSLLMMFEEGCLYGASLRCMDSETCIDARCVPSRLEPGELPDLPDAMDADGGPGIITGVPPTGSTGNPQMTAGAGGAAGGGGGASGSGDAGGGGPTAGGAGDPGIPIGVGCGNGMLDNGEACDIAIAAGQSGACPTTCPTTVACESNVLEGGACQVRCRNTPITQPAPGDGCCPPGVDANNDSDCGAVCGNGIVESGETCDPHSSCPAPEACAPAGACLRAVPQGATSTCNFACQMEQITMCQGRDGCCPDACSSVNDSDCSASCGDGVVDVAALETCEPGSPTAPCPSTCDDGNACTLDFMTGSVRNCNSLCFNIPILVPLDRDGCCAPNANANTDDDCPPRCGNGVTEAGERCDGNNCPTTASCNDGNACTRDSVTGNDCQRQCSHAAIGASRGGQDGCCPAGANANTDSDCGATCGNGVTEPPERCDGSNCPSDCNDNNACTTDRLAGSGCDVRCEHSTVTCGTNAMCVPASGCRCRDGFMGDGQTCVDPCAGNPCGANGTCERTSTGFMCNCRNGFSGPTCAMENECERSPSPCGANGTCRDTATSFECTCRDGFAGTPCEDVDECDRPGTCAANQRCDNTPPGSFTCTDLPPTDGGT